MLCQPADHGPQSLQVTPASLSEDTFKVLKTLGSFPPFPLVGEGREKLKGSEHWQKVNG
jgi:hypothetical protein